MLSSQDWGAIALSLKLAAVTTVLLLVIATPLAWGLARCRAWWKAPVGAVVALPLVLPPTVIGFYLLLAFGPHGPVGQFTQGLGLGSLSFTFAGLAAASVVYSLPFAVQPLQNAFEAVGKQPLEAAATLRAPPWDVFFSVVLPLAKTGYFTAALMVFAHTLGEFGVVLMIGGNIPEQTRVASVQIYQHVEALEYAPAHGMAACMLGLSFILLLALHLFQSKRGRA